MEIFAAVAVCCLGKHNDNAALLHRHLCCRHALYGLVNVLVQRIAPFVDITISAGTAST